jgi:hypothetical protein
VLSSLIAGEPITTGKLVGAAISGAITGAVMGSVAGALAGDPTALVAAGMAVGMVAGGAGNLAEQLVDNRGDLSKVDPDKLFTSTVFGGITGAVGAGVGAGLTSLAARSLGTTVDQLGRSSMACGLGFMRVAGYTGLNMAIGSGTAVTVDATMQTINILAGAQEGWNVRQSLAAFTTGGAGAGLGYLGARAFLRVCFAAGTPLLTPEGSKAVEQFLPGDWILSRDENDPEGRVEPRLVEEVFVRVGKLLNLRVGGRVIGTTGEHPFWVRGKGWMPAAELRAGDELSSHDGCLVIVDGIEDTRKIATVYNLRVAEYHTYFVGSEEWGWSVWVHNEPCGVERRAHKFEDGSEADTVAVVYRFKRGTGKGQVNAAQEAELRQKYAKANELLASGEEVATVPPSGSKVRNDRNARRRFIRETDNPIDPETNRPVPMDKIKNPSEKQVDEYVGVGWGGRARVENQHYISTKTNQALGGKDKAIYQKLRQEGLTGVRVREFRVIFED